MKVTSKLTYELDKGVFNIVGETENGKTSIWVKKGQYSQSFFAINNKEELDDLIEALNEMKMIYD